MSGDRPAEAIVVPEHVVFRHFPAETVVLNLQTGLYHGLNPVAGRMFESLVEHGRRDAAVEAVLADFEAERARVETDLDELIVQLSSRGLVSTGEAGP